MEEYKSPLNGQPTPTSGRFKRGDERAREAAKKSVEKRKERNKIKKTLREELELLLSEERAGPGGKPMTVQAGITSSLVKQALEGNTRAYEIIRDTLGQKPVEKVEVHDVDYSVLDAIRSELMG